MPFVNEWFKNTNNNSKIHFIFIETYENLNMLKIEDWYQTIVDNNYGVWLGGDVASQTVISFSNLTSDDRTINSPEYCFVAEKGKRKLIKHITCKNDEEVIEFISNKGLSKEFGAREIIRVINSEISSFDKFEAFLATSPRISLKLVFTTCSSNNSSTLTLKYLANLVMISVRGVLSPLKYLDIADSLI